MKSFTALSLLLTSKFASAGDWAFTSSGETTNGYVATTFITPSLWGYMVVERTSGSFFGLYPYSKATFVGNNTSSSWSTPSHSDNITGNGKAVWEWDPHGSHQISCYRFTFSLQGVASVEAQMEVQNLSGGKGELRGTASCQIIGQTSGGLDKDVGWSVAAGVKVASEAGFTGWNVMSGPEGAGIGVQWSNGDDQLDAPYHTETKTFVVSGTRDNPGSQCSVEVLTFVEVYGGSLSYTMQYTNELHANAYLNPAYPSFELGEPQLIAGCGH